jgi:hypothetical protein
MSALLDNGFIIAIIRTLQMPLTFQEKRALQKIIVEQNKILVANPSFTEKRAAQKAKLDALAKLGKVKQPSSMEGAENQGSGANTGAESNNDQGNFGLQSGGIKTRERINAQVASLVDQIRAGKDPKSLNSDEIALFRQYSGKGGLTENSQYEYYTPTHVAEGVWDLLKENGFENGNVLEPSTGSGVFSATKAPGVLITGTEIDPIAATVNQVLHPDDKIINQSFEKLAVSAPDNHFDAVIGNIPFGDARGPSAKDDPQYRSEKQIERYFIHRVIDKTRPGGLIALVVPTKVIGNTQAAWKKFRAEISRKAEFLGGHKLPSKTFGKQGTDVVTDIIVLRKHSADLLDKIGGLESDTLKAANVLWDEFITGKYWQGEGLKFIKGQYVPPNKDDFRPMEKVIAEEGMTDEALKRALAVKFDSRIDWELLDSVEPVINYYSEGDHRIINGKDHVFENGQWHEVVYTVDTATGFDKAKFGADSLEALEEILKSPELMLKLTAKQAANALDAYPNLFGDHQMRAVLFAWAQPLDALQEQAYRGSLIGSMVTRFVAKANQGDTDSTEQARIQALLEQEFKTYGHPKSIKGFMLQGEQARYFGAYLGAIDEQGTLSKVITEGVEDANGYTADNPLSIVEYFQREGLSDVTLDDFNRLYTGGRTIDTMGDLADVEGIVFTPSGFISTVKDYCNGDIYQKIADIQNVMEGESDPRVKDKYQKTIDLLLSKAKHTNIEDISFGLRDKWFDQKYKIEFLEKSGYKFDYRKFEIVEKQSETGEIYNGGQYTRDTQDMTGQWAVDAGQRKRNVFARQLEYYMNGQSIAFRMAKTDDADKQRINDLRLQVNNLEEQFKYFMQSHADFKDIERSYNRTFNNYVKPDYDTSDLGLKTSSGKVKLHWYQNQAVRQFSETGTGILGLDVGLGKSFTALALSAYDRQMGRSKKHCIVVPKSVLANWYMESKKLYGNHDDVMFVGFEPDYDKNGVIKQEPVLDENGKPQVNKFTQEVEYQDVLRADSPDEIYAKMHQIPHTKKSVVIMTQERFKEIPLREETRLNYTQQWVDKSMMSKSQADKLIASAGNETEASKKVSYNDAKNQDRLRGQFSDEGGAKKDEYPYFEDMGFDRVIVDEAHQFRNSYQIQDGDTQKLAYLPNAAISQRATDMAMKTAYLRDRYDGKGPILLTATPVANSPIEIFNMLSLVIDQSEFERIGVFTPDDFVRQYGIIQDVDKLTVRGTVEKREGLAGFKNLNALRGLFHRYALMRGPKDVDPEGNVMKLPMAIEMIDQMEMNDDQKELYESLRLEAKDAGNPQKIKAGEARPMFAVLRDMDRVTTDVDMYHGVITYLFKAADESKVKALIDNLPATAKISMRDEDTGEKYTDDIDKTTDYTIKGGTLTYVAPEAFEEFINNRLTKFKIDYVSHPLRPKYAKLIENMQAELDSQGKQLVFTEEKSQHSKLLRLIVNHLPVSAAQVEIINADTAKDEKLQQISDAYNRGDVRIIIANKKAEVGVNLQKGTSAIHHMTLPWNPASLQQRNGRGVRQGNTRDEARVYYYQAKGSFDEYRLDLLKNKGNWIAALMDRHNDDDSAENAEAMGAIEQAALLSDNREEFLKTMAEQKAKKAAEDKARRDNTAKIKLGQLALAVNFLATFEDQKAKAIADAQREAEKAKIRYENLKAAGEDKEEIDRAEIKAAAAIKRADKVAENWDKKKADNEAMQRQLTSFLKGMAGKGELPFDSAVIDAPEKTLFTKNRQLISVGSTYKFRYNQFERIARVTEVDYLGRTVKLEAITGYQMNGSYDVDGMLGEAVEVKLAPDELARLAWLNKNHYYKDLLEVDKDFFANNLDSIQFSGDALFRNSAGLLNWGYAGSNRSAIVYPDKYDKALQNDLIDAYKQMKTGNPVIYPSAFKNFMPIFFGDDWEAGILAQLKTASPEEIRIQAVKSINEAIKDMPVGTPGEIAAIMRGISYSTWGDNPYRKAVSAVSAWMSENDYINLDQVDRIVQETATAKITELQEKRRQIEAEEQRAKEEALKAVPGYREMPAGLKDKFKALNIDVFFNTETVQIATRYDKVTLQPYDAFWMKDNGWTLKTKLSGAENPLKRQFVAKFLGVKYASELPQGDRKYGNATWRVPSDVDLEALYEALK